MRSPSDIARKLASQWYQPAVRIARLLNTSSWPLYMPIGKPSARVFSENTHAVQKHAEAWRRVDVGDVEWGSVNYRAGLEPVSLPLRWCLSNPSEWVEAAADQEVFREYARLAQLVEQVDKTFHTLLVAQRSLWMKRDLQEVIVTATLAKQLTPGCARGRPLRLLAEHGVDTKFFERNSSLLTKLLDECFEGEVSEQGLITFLDAFEETSHWVLIVPLSAGLLPFKRMRLTTEELAEVDLPCARVLVVENEQCIHQLPQLPNTIAVLGAGLDLGWLASPMLTKKSIGYWGDMDTWGLQMLGRARRYQPTITPLLMERSFFDKYASGHAVVEPVKAQDAPPSELSNSEAGFYRYLLKQERGRLEQEFLPKEEVVEILSNWVRLA